jgi:hypothetical protein
MSLQVSWTVGLLPAVEPSLLLTHRLLAVLVTRNLPLAAAEAVNVHCWLVFVPSPQPHCCSCVPDTVDEDGTSAHLVLPTFTRLNAPREGGAGVFRNRCFGCDRITKIVKLIYSTTDRQIRSMLRSNVGASTVSS